MDNLITESFVLTKSYFKSFLMLQIKVSIELFRFYILFYHRKSQNGDEENLLYQFMQHKKALLAFFVRSTEGNKNGGKSVFDYN